MLQLNNFSISNIAWEKDQTETIFKLMYRYSFTGLEIAPTKVFSDIPNLSDSDVAEYRNYCMKYNIMIVAMQSLLFGRSDLTIFDSYEQRKELKAYLKKIFHLGYLLGLHVVVFGSPKNRIIPQSMTSKTAQEIAQNFFYEVGEMAKDYNLFFCIESNPSFYGGNYLINSYEVVDLVKQVNHPNIRFHLDTGAIFLAGEDPEDVIKQAYPYLKHCHISEKGLKQVSVSDSIKQHEIIAKTLKELEYKGWVSIEMRASESSSENPLHVEHSLAFVKNMYGS